MILTLDCETTIFQKGSPYSRRNKLCYVGLSADGAYENFDIEYSSSPYGDLLPIIKSRIEEAELLVCFNVKFDLHWINRYVTLEHIPPVWDCQLAEFILSHQTWAYPDLDEACFRRGLGRKLDIVKLDYWDNGIDTPDVPESILQAYLLGDVELTIKLYKAQLEIFNNSDPRLFNLFRLQCADLLLLAQIERNGLLFDVEQSLELAEQSRISIHEIDQQLNELVGYDVPNWNSTDVQSATLYGGLVSFPCRVQTQRTLKDGSIKLGERWGWETKEFPRLVEPLKGTETLPTSGWDDVQLAQRNAGRPKLFFRVYSVGESNLQSLRAKGTTKRCIELILERANINKLESTYYRGLPQMMEEMDWEPGVIHGQLNQVVAVTGRLSASRPNQQNFSGEIKHLFRSRYDD